MKTTMKMALAFATLASLAGSAHAQSGPEDTDRNKAGFGIRQVNFEALDADKTGDVSFQEFKKAAGDRFQLADADKDGKVTVEEMAAAIEKTRAEKMANRMIKRFDVDGDGAVTQAEIDTNQQEMYALLDKNNDGKLVEAEMPAKKKGWGGRKDNN
ncbi:MAG: EF-hand domain-containing protein [Rhizobiaceae bacterium]